MSKTTKNVLVAVPVILLLLAIAIPNFIKSHATISMSACANNLRQIDNAKKEWALKNQKTIHDTPTWDDLRLYFTPGHPIKGLPSCPAGGVYTIGSIGEPARCSIGGSLHSFNPD
jgi:hypothetical protein